MRPVTRFLTLAAALALVAGCAPTGGGASGEPSDDSASAITVEVADTDAGPSLVGPDGRTLYIFTQDADGRSTCNDDCATMWPPLEVDDGATIEAGEGVTGELTIIERDDGGSQVAYDGMPLYFYASDSGPGDATGEGVGGVWFIASPEGRGAQPSEDAEPSDDDMSEPSESAEPTPDYGY